MKARTRSLIFALLVLAVAALAAPSTKSGIDLSAMDRSVEPGNDFFDYSNGAWLKSTEIPPDKGATGAFYVLIDKTRERVRKLIQESSESSGGASPERRKVGDFYASFMDEGAIEQKGLAPLKPQLEEIAAIRDRKMLARAIGASLRADVDALNSTNFYTDHLFGVWVTQSLTDPQHSVPYLLQGGLGLPDRDYYLSDSEHMVTLRKQYQQHVAATLKLAGFSNPEERAAGIFSLETKIARAHMTRVESEDVHNATEWKRADFDQKAPGLDWDVVFEAAGLSDAPVFILWHPKAIPGLAALVSSEPLNEWKDWLAYHTVEHWSNFLPKAFVDEHFNFYGKDLNGIPQQRSRWQRGVDFTNFSLGDEVGKLYAEQYFPPEAKARIQALVENLMKVYAQRIDALSWMSAQTKARAKEKLATLKVGVGYPDTWTDYSALKISKDDALGNAQRAELFYYRQQLAKLHEAVDRGEWWMTPQTVNAVNLPLQNALNFPAAILQPPFFDPDADPAANYGATGATIGHEISHSFDDQGSQFDAEGRLANWWTPEDFAHFKAAGEALAAQYDRYKPFPDLSLNGHQTLSENIADLAGLAAAYDAYHLSLGSKPAPVIDGLTGDQRFFIAYAQSWQEKMRPALLRNQVLTDGHSPGEYRTDTVRNLDPWYKAFSVEPAEKMYLAPKDRVQIW
ncbi:MAG: M13 family metallopeptidase [Deltaproteobacteria bacterium]